MSIEAQRTPGECSRLPIERNPRAGRAVAARTRTACRPESAPPFL